MKVSFNWLNEFVKLPPTVTIKELAERLTRQVVEIDDYVSQGQGLEKVLAGKVTEVANHPQADKIGVATIDVGQTEELTIIFGKVLPLKVGDIVAVAVAPCVLPTGAEVRQGEIRGVESQGMVCVDEELGLQLGGKALDDPKHPGQQIHLTYLPKGTKPGTPLAQALQLNDTVLEIAGVAITNRSDLWGHYGLAREIAAMYELHLAPIKLSVPKDNNDKKVKVDLQTPLCQRYLAARLNNVKIQDSPAWLKARLEAVGIRSINNVVDVTNYVMFELGQPLHSFDADRLQADKIVVRQAKKDEKLITLDGSARDIPEGSLLICDGEKPAAIAGIMGGQSSEINNDTVSVIFESATFDPVIIRRAEDELDMRTEASIRFEKGLNPEIAEAAMLRALTLLKKVCPSMELVAPITDEGEAKISPVVQIEIPMTKISQCLGISLDATQAINALKPLGFSVKKSAKDKLMVTVPYWRATNVIMPEDVIEEVGRRLGYDQIVPRLPLRSLAKTINKPVQRLCRDLKLSLSLRSGFIEVQTHSFVLPSILPHADGLELAKPPAAELSRLRMTILPNLMAILSRNIRQQNELALFELGRVFRLGSGSYDIAPDSSVHLPAQPRSLAMVLTSPSFDETKAFRNLKGAIQDSLDQAGYEVSWGVAESQPPLADWLELNKTILVKVNGEDIGYVTVLPREILQAGKIRSCVAAAELDLTKLGKIPPRVKQLQPISKYPGIIEDVSLLIPQQAHWADIYSAVIGLHPLIKNCELFDVYEGNKIGEHKRSLAFHIIFNADDRTLTDEEVKQIMEKVRTELVKKFKAEIR